MQFYTIPSQHLLLHFFSAIRTCDLIFNLLKIKSAWNTSALFLSGPSKPILCLPSQLLRFFASLYRNTIFAKDRPYRLSGALPWAVKMHLALFLLTNVIRASLL